MWILLATRSIECEMLIKVGIFHVLDTLDSYSSHFGITKKAWQECLLICNGLWWVG